MREFLSEVVKIVEGFKPDADALAGTVQSEAVNMGLYERATFILHRGAGTTGTQTITMQASTDAAQSGAEAIAFRRRTLDTYPISDALGSASAVTSAGFTTTAGGDNIEVIEVKAEDMPDGKKWLNLKSVEVVDAADDASLIILLSNSRYQGDTLPVAIS